MGRWGRCDSVTVVADLIVFICFVYISRHNARTLQQQTGTPTTLSHGGGYVCLFVDYHHHYTAHSRFVEIPHEWCAMRVSCEFPIAIDLNQEAGPNLGGNRNGDIFESLFFDLS